MSATAPADKLEDKEKKEKETTQYAEREAEREQTARYAQLEQEVAQLKAKNAETEKRAAISERKSKIHSLRLLGVDLDEEAETERCSLENMPTEREFQTAMDLIVKYAQKIPLGVSLHTPDAPIIEDRHAAAVRMGRSKSTDPEFVNTEEFAQEVVAYAQLDQARADYAPDPGDYKRYRAAIIERRSAKTGAAKVG